MSEKMVPYETIVKALQQDDSAIVEILLHYRSFLQKLAGREVEEANGQRYHAVDEEMMLRLEVKLITSLPKFRFLPEEKSV